MPRDFQGMAQPGTSSAREAATGMATTNHCASISAELAHAPRFRFGSLEAWRAALFVSLGFGAGCADTDQTVLPGADEPALPDSLRPAYFARLTSADSC